MNDNIAGVLILEFDTQEMAERNAKIMRDCPRIVIAGSSGSTAYDVFIIPKAKRWWLEYPSKHPEVFRAKSAKLELIEDIAHPLEFSLKLPEKKLETPPCGSNCLACPALEMFGCKGCPATVSYRGSE